VPPSEHLHSPPGVAQGLSADPALAAIL
jgi:hypothetical protein